MGYVYYYSKDILKPSRVAEMMKRLNIQSVRSWSHIPWVLKDEKTVNNDIADGFHRMYDELLKAGVSQLVGMSHYWFYPSRFGVAGENSGIPLPSQQKGSDYQDFLDKNPGAKIYMATTKGKNVYTEVSYEPDCYIMFGKESAGIPEEILVQHQEDCVRIPMVGDIRSLNLSNSVSIVLYEALRQNGFAGMNLEGHLHRLHWGDSGKLL